MLLIVSIAIKEKALEFARSGVVKVQMLKKLIAHHAMGNILFSLFRNITKNDIFNIDTTGLFIKFFL